MGWGLPSRTRQHAEERARIHVSEGRLAELETEVEDSERRNLRLTKELMKETALRARSERQRDDAKVQIEDLTVRLSEVEGKPNEPSGPVKGTAKGKQRPGSGRKVSARSQRVDGSPPSKRKRAAKPADSSGAGSKAGPPVMRQSSRTRGKVK